MGKTNRRVARVGEDLLRVRRDGAVLEEVSNKFDTPIARILRASWASSRWFSWSPVYGARVGILGWWVIGPVPRSVATSANPVDSDGLRDLLDHVVEGPGFFVTAARKCLPFEIFVEIVAPTGLARSLTDSVLWSPARAAEALAELATIVESDPAARAELIRLAADAVDTQGDEPDYDAEELITGPLRALRHAVVHDLDVLAVAAIN